MASAARTAEAVADTVAVYERMLAEEAGLDRAGLIAAGVRVADALEPRWPDLVRELEALAAGAGQPLELLLALNARTELLAGAPAAECSRDRRRRRVRRLHGRADLGLAPGPAPRRACCGRVAQPAGGGSPR